MFTAYIRRPAFQPYSSIRYSCARFPPPYIIRSRHSQNLRPRKNISMRRFRMFTAAIMSVSRIWYRGFILSYFGNTTAGVARYWEFFGCWDQILRRWVVVGCFYGVFGSSPAAGIKYKDDGSFLDFVTGRRRELELTKSRYLCARPNRVSYADGFGCWVGFCA